jgi:hypothetical protein
MRFLSYIMMITVIKAFNPTYLVQLERQTKDLYIKNRQPIRCNITISGDLLLKKHRGITGKDLDRFFW